jgi:hypothetical protein
MAFDSHITKPSSSITGTIALGFFASRCGSDSRCSKGRSSSAQVHSTLRTLMEVFRPSTRSVIASYFLSRSMLLMRPSTMMTTMGAAPVPRS